MIRVERILVPVDFSGRPEDVAQYAVEIGRMKSAGIYFLHVIHQSIVDAVQTLNKKGYKGDFVQAYRKLVGERERDLERLVSGDLREGLEVEFLVRKGDPAEEVVRVAGELFIDLVVIGGQVTRDGTGTVRLGSVTRHVVERAPCPVLLVKPIEHDFPRSSA